MFLNKTKLMNGEIIGNHASIINVIGSLNNVLIEYLHTWLHHFIHGNDPLGPPLHYLQTRFMVNESFIGMSLDGFFQVCRSSSYFSFVFLSCAARIRMFQPFLQTFSQITIQIFDQAAMDLRLLFSMYHFTLPA